MARTAWYAGRGNWKDSEMSFFGTPFEEEWNRLEAQIGIIIAGLNGEDWFGDTSSADMYNRDRVYWDGRKFDSPLYWRRTSIDPEPTTEIPI
jgi:hypothetical protein